MKNMVFVNGVTIAVLLLCGCIFFGCAGVDGGNGADPAPTRKRGNAPDRIWTIEDYTRELGTFEGLDVETEWQILLDYYSVISQELLGTSYSLSINDLYINGYFGTYNGYVVIRIADGLPFVLPGIPSYPYQIDGIVFPWLSPSYPFPKTWNNGKFYILQELYDSGLLTRDDLESIASWGVK